MLLEVNVKNLKVLKGEHKISPDGQSFVVLGDSGFGKTTLLEIISAHLMKEDYPQNPLTDGENDGFTETVHQIEGVKYSIKRKFKRQEDGTVKLERFAVTSATGGKYSLTAFLETVLKGAFNSGKFDYSKFFFECKSPEARYKYLIDSIGGDEVYANNKLVTELEGERAAVGTQRTLHKAAWEQEGIFKAETVEKDLIYYEKEKTTEEAQANKQQYLAKRKSIVLITQQKQEVANSNKMYNDEKKGIEDDETGLQSLKKEYEELGRKIKEKELAITSRKNGFKKFKLDETLEQSLAKQLETVEADNKLIEKEADTAYDKEVGLVNLFNVNRKNFMDTIASFRLWEAADKEWVETDNKIKEIREKNKTIFSNRLPIPELTIGEVNGKEVVLYKGKEFSWDNLSKGETIKITARIQRALNPAQDSFIVIPEAQSLGSNLDDILKECKEYGVQACVEYTQRNEDFKMVFVDDFIKEN
jgi:energy-coupling factor transporter ATP-binding protein EcfA2